MSTSGKSPTRLRKLRITRVDTVTAGANQHARIMLHKSADHPCDACGVAKALTNIKPSSGKKCPVCGRVVPEATAKGDMPMSDDLTALAAAIEKAAGEAVTAATADLEARLAEITAERDTLTKAQADPDEINKADLPEPVRKRLEALEADAAANAERVAKMEDDAAAAQWLDVAKGLDLVAVAKATDGNAVADLAGALKSVAAAVDPATVTTLVDTLKAAQARLSESALFAEAGVATGTPSSAEAQLDALAKGFMEADGLSYPVAIDRAATVRPDLAGATQEEIWNA